LIEAWLSSDGVPRPGYERPQSTITLRPGWTVVMLGAHMLEYQGNQ